MGFNIAPIPLRRLLVVPYGDCDSNTSSNISIQMVFIMCIIVTTFMVASILIPTVDIPSFYDTLFVDVWFRYLRYLVTLLLV